MRELGSVCARCQLRLLVASRARARRGISSCSSSAAVDEESGVSVTPTHNGPWVTAATPVHRRDLDDSVTTPAPTQSPAPRHPSGPRRASSLAVFQSIVESQARRTGAPGDSAVGTAGLELVKDVARMQTMLEREGATLAAAYAYFEEAIYPQVARSGVGTVPQIIRNQVATVLLNRLALEKPADFESNSLPSVTRITEILIELDVLRPSAWATLVIELLRHIYKQHTVPDAYSSVKAYETAMAQRDALLRDLLGAWRVFCDQRSSTEVDASAKSSEVNDTKAPSPRTGGRPRQQSTTLQAAFGAMFPQYLVSTLLRPTFAAFATYKLLTDPFNRTRSIKEDAGPFLQMMKGLIFRTRPPRPEDFGPVFDAFPDLPRLVWPRQPAADDKANEFLDSTSVFGDKSEARGVTIHRQLGDAIKGMNVAGVQKAWLLFWGDADLPDAARVEELVQCPGLFDYFILAYTMMRRPQQAIAVWNNMERIGVKATIKTWNSMLQGCVKANNSSGLKAVWTKLMASGTKLDQAIWTSRIHGLFACGEPDAGLRALDEMARVWASRKDPRYAAAAVQPGIESVNAALAGLLRLNRNSDATNVLVWASKHGIDPDIYTFNTLLRPLIRRGDMKGVAEVFDTMRSANIRADVATFTVLLDGVLNHIGDLPPDQQVALIERVLAEMRASGVEINMRTYAKIIHLLLREGDRTEQPVKAVLAHIWGRGLELNSHIYTMLAEHYFTRHPPDVAAVTALIENRRLHANRGIDRVFWERVIKGYAQAGELVRALDIFDRVFVNGVTITFSTLYDLLKPLVAAGDRAAATRVVEAARKIGRADDAAAAVSGSEGGRYWRHRFWHLAYEQGLMGEQLAERFRLANAAPL